MPNHYDSGRHNIFYSYCDSCNKLIQGGRSRCDACIKKTADEVDAAKKPMRQPKPRSLATGAMSQETRHWLEEDQRKEGDAADIQVLIDFAFHAAFAASTGAIYNGTGEPEEIAKWVRTELYKLGFETKAVYDKNKCLWRWGVLVEK